MLRRFEWLYRRFEGPWCLHIQCQAVQQVSCSDDTVCCLTPTMKALPSRRNVDRASHPRRHITAVRISSHVTSPSLLVLRITVINSNHRLLKVRTIQFYPGKVSKVAKFLQDRAVVGVTLLTRRKYVTRTLRALQRVSAKLQQRNDSNCSREPTLQVLYPPRCVLKVTQLDSPLPSESYYRTHGCSHFLGQRWNPTTLN